MIRRYGERLKPGRQYRRRQGVYAILMDDDGLLLTHQAEPIPEYQLPGGGIDPGENPIGALHREVWEETGWRIATPRRIGAYRRFTYMPEYDLWAEKLCTIYLARPVLQIGPPAEPGHSAIWTDAGAGLALLTNEGDREMLAQLLATIRRQADPAQPGIRRQVCRRRRDVLRRPVVVRTGGK